MGNSTRLAGIRAVFFSFDGIDGTGKSTQARLFCDWLRAQGHAVQACRDPGGTELGEALRRLLLESDCSIGRRAEALLYMSSRAQLVEQVIVPALDRGAIVVADRYLLANVVYQGHAGGLDAQALWEIGQFATAGVLPDLTFVLDMPPEAAAARLQRPLDRMERHDPLFKERLRQGYLQEAARRPASMLLVNAARPIDEVQRDIRAAADRLLTHGKPVSQGNAGARGATGPGMP